MNTFYRGKDIETGDWIYGTSIISRNDWSDISKTWTQRYFLLEGDACNQTPEIKEFIEVKANTVGRDTGLTDKNVRNIYEGDIVFFNGKLWKESPVEYYPRSAGYLPFVQYDYPGDTEVVGNVHDNPELLK